MTPRFHAYVLPPSLPHPSYPLLSPAHLSPADMSAEESEVEGGWQSPGEELASTAGAGRWGRLGLGGDSLRWLAVAWVAVPASQPSVLLCFPLHPPRCLQSGSCICHLCSNTSDQLLLGNPGPAPRGSPVPPRTALQAVPEVRERCLCLWWSVWLAQQPTRHLMCHWLALTLLHVPSSCPAPDPAKPTPPQPPISHPVLQDVTPSTKPPPSAGGQRTPPAPLVIPAGRCPSRDQHPTLLRQGRFLSCLAMGPPHVCFPCSSGSDAGQELSFGDGALSRQVL